MFTLYLQLLVLFIISSISPISTERFSIDHWSSPASNELPKIELKNLDDELKLVADLVESQAVKSANLNSIVEQINSLSQVRISDRHYDSDKLTSIARGFHKTRDPDSLAKSIAWKLRRPLAIIESSFGPVNKFPALTCDRTNYPGFCKFLKLYVGEHLRLALDQIDTNFRSQFSPAEPSCVKNFDKLFVESDQDQTSDSQLRTLARQVSFEGINDETREDDEQREYGLWFINEQCGEILSSFESSVGIYNLAKAFVPVAAQKFNPQDEAFLKVNEYFRLCEEFSENKKVDCDPFCI